MGMLTSKPNSGTLLGASIRTKLFDNTVTAQMSVLLSSRGKRMHSTVLVSPSFDSLPVSETQLNTQASTGSTPQVPYTDRGTAGLLLRAAAYYDPKLIGTVLGKADPTTDDNPKTGQAGTNDQLTRGVEPGRGPSRIDPEA